MTAFGFGVYSLRRCCSLLAQEEEVRRRRKGGGGEVGGHAHAVESAAQGEADGMNMTETGVIDPGLVPVPGLPLHTTGAAGGTNPTTRRSPLSPWSHRSGETKVTIIIRVIKIIDENHLNHQLLRL